MGEQEIIDLIESVLDSALERIELKELDEATSVNGLFTMGTTSTGSSYKVPMPLMKGEAPVLTVEIDERGHLVVDVEYKVWDTIPPIVFADPLVANILFTNELISNPTYSTKEELAGITSIGTLFMGSEITSFDELQYFTGVTSLGDMCFYYCENLTSIVIPDSVTSLGDMCFGDCSSLTTVTLESITPPTISSNTFESTIEKFYVPSSSVEAYKTATNWTAYASKIFPIT